MGRFGGYDAAADAKNSHDIIDYTLATAATVEDFENFLDRVGRIILPCERFKNDGMALNCIAKEGMSMFGVELKWKRPSEEDHEDEDSDDGHELAPG